MRKRTVKGDSSPEGLTIIQDKLLQALLLHPTMKAAAEVVGIDERTARRHLDDPAFQAAYERAKEAIDAEIRNGLVSLASKSLEGLNKLIDDPECPHPTKAKVYLSFIERRAPMPSATQQQPLQGQGVQLYDSRLIQYATSEELEAVMQIIERAQARKAEAEGQKNTSPHTSPEET